MLEGYIHKFSREILNFQQEKFFLQFLTGNME